MTLTTPLLCILISTILVFNTSVANEKPSNDTPPAEREFSESFYNEISNRIYLRFRSEILPEIRELSLLSRKVRKKNIQLKGKKFEKLIVGRVEWIELDNPKVRFKARVDTGAQTNSMHAENIKEKQIQGESYVEFTTKDFSGNKHTLLKKVIKKSKVKGTSGISGNRYVIRLNVLFGDRSIETNVNLNDRSNLRHKFLVGRNLLIGDYIVDVSQSRVLGGKQ